MLHVPANSRNTFTICATDPGTHNLGFCALHVDMFTYKPTSYDVFTLQATKLMDDEDLLVATHGHTFARCDALKEAIIQKLRFYRPSVFASEDAFFSRRFPGAFAPLLMSINSIRQAVLEYNPYLPFTLIEPSVIKKAVGAQGGGSNKAVVLDCIRKIAELDVPTRTPLVDSQGKQLQTEHAIDSLAIAYARLKQIR